jgi:hypothetical protein
MSTFPLESTNRPPTALGLPFRSPEGGVAVADPPGLVSAREHPELPDVPTPHQPKAARHRSSRRNPSWVSCWVEQ